MTTLTVAEASPPQFQVITFVGHLTADPVTKQLSDDRKVCNLRLAVNDQKDQPPLFIDVATFGTQAEACAKYLSKGRAVAVTGRLTYREWEAEDGTRRSKHYVIGRVQFGGGGRPNGDQPAEVDTPEAVAA
jgi:single-strand DNA-binding protein